MTGAFTALMLALSSVPPASSQEKLLADFEEAQLASWESTLKGTQRKESRSRSGDPVIELATPGGLYNYKSWWIYKGLGQGGGNALGIGWSYTNTLYQYGG